MYATGYKYVATEGKMIVEFIEPGSINPDASIDNECPSN